MKINENQGSLFPASRVMMQCAVTVNREAISREVINGAEHIIIESFTLPDDVVMNGGLYPSQEIADSFKSLERTLAPVEHPTDAQGNFISATDPIAIHDFHAGAFNTNVTRENGRVRIEKHINVQEALKSEKGKRLLDRVEELENNSDPRPIHTSVGVFLVPTELDAPRTNAAGKEYTWIASEMTFDHDAILLDSIGAAQPSQGVGIGVNSEGQEFEVQHFVLNDELLAQPEETPILSHEELRDALLDTLNKPPLSADWIERVFDGQVIYSLADQLFTVPYLVSGEAVTIVGIPVPVERDISYSPKTNLKGNAMKDLIVSALVAAGIEVADLDEAQLFAKYNELQAVKPESTASASEGAAIAEAITNALSPVVERLSAIEAGHTAKANAELDTLAATVADSGLYPNLDAESAKCLPVEKLREFAALATPSHGIPLINNGKGGDDTFAVNTDMPEQEHSKCLIQERE